MSSDQVRAAYTERADEYVDALGSMESVHSADRELVTAWAQIFDGPVIDAGCGPGHWTNLLHGSGVAVEGVDLVPAFITRAKERYPDVPFRVGALDALGVPEGSIAGVLAWYSIIHLPPADVRAVLDEFARCIAPGGTLLVGFFEGSDIEPFPHKVVTAYYWPVDELSRQLAGAGFETIETHARTDPGTRAHAAIVARRVSAARAASSAARV